MPPSETTDEKRSRSYWGFVLVGAVVIVATAFILWPRAGERQNVSLTVLLYAVDRVDRPMVIARVAVTNNTKETLVLGNSGKAWRAHLCVLGQTRSGWKSQPGGVSLWAVGPVPSKLLPGQGFRVEGAIPMDRPCKLGLDYLNDRLSGRIWQKLPTWVKEKLSWASPWRTATTELIDPSKPLKMRRSDGRGVAP